MLNKLVLNINVIKKKTSLNLGGFVFKKLFIICYNL